jgi:hypothetical protein
MNSPIICANCGHEKGYFGQDEHIRCAKCNGMAWTTNMNNNINEAPMPGQEAELPELEIGALIPHGGELTSGPIGIPQIDATTDPDSLAAAIEAFNPGSAIIRTGRSRSA